IRLSKISKDTYHDLQNDVNTGISGPWSLRIALIRVRLLVNDELLNIQTSGMLRGLAILLLLLGHFALKCVHGEYFFESAGMWAVIIFLFISGIALTKRYGLTGLGKTFLMKRLRNLLPPTWITLTLFYILDFAFR